MTAPERIELRELRDDLLRTIGDLKTEIREQRQEFRAEVEKLHARISHTNDALATVRSMHDACSAARAAERQTLDPWANWARSLLLVLLTSIITLAARQAWEQMFL